ncbi:hypothetical protein B0T13DRAFT_448898 [Neurospora crassa]|nr:hypothetical protein B0T13DRAFT_448898 [Neurospora crassa]
MLYLIKRKDTLAVFLIHWSIISTLLRPIYKFIIIIRSLSDFEFTKKYNNKFGRFENKEINDEEIESERIQIKIRIKGAIYRQMRETYKSSIKKINSKNRYTLKRNKYKSTIYSKRRYIPGPPPLVNDIPTFNNTPASAPVFYRFEIKNKKDTTESDSNKEFRCNKYINKNLIDKSNPVENPNLNYIPPARIKAEKGLIQRKYRPKIIVINSNKDENNSKENNSKSNKNINKEDNNEDSSKNNKNNNEENNNEDKDSEDNKDKNNSEEDNEKKDNKGEEDKEEDKEEENKESSSEEDKEEDKESSSEDNKEEEDKEEEEEEEEDKEEEKDKENTTAALKLPTAVPKPSAIITLKPPATATPKLPAAALKLSITVFKLSAAALKLPITTPKPFTTTPEPLNTLG